MADHPGRRVAGWILLALAGLAIAVALSVTAGNLATQPIGISGEPLRAGDKLAPKTAARAPAHARPRKSTGTRRRPPQALPTGTQTAPQPTAPVTTPTTPIPAPRGTSTAGGSADDSAEPSGAGPDD